MIYGEAFIEDFSVEYIRVSSINELDRIHRSKYVQNLISEKIYERFIIQIFLKKMTILTKWLIDTSEN